MKDIEKSLQEKKPPHPSAAAAAKETDSGKPPQSGASAPKPPPPGRLEDQVREEVRQLLHKEGAANPPAGKNSRAFPEPRERLGW